MKHKKREPKDLCESIWGIGEPLGKNISISMQGNTGKLGERKIRKRRGNTIKDIGRKKHCKRGSKMSDKKAIFNLIVALVLMLLTK